MTAIIYFKELKYDGKEWKVAVPITVPEKSLTAGSDNEVFTPESGFAVLNIELKDTSGAENNITIKDDTTTIKTVTIPANGSATLSGIVIKKKLVINPSGSATVFVTGEDYKELIE